MPAADARERAAHVRAWTHGATLYMVLLAAYHDGAASLHRAGGHLIGSPIAGRTRAEVEGLIGYFANTLVHARATSAAIRRSPSCSSGSRESALARTTIEDVPFEKLVLELRRRT